MLPFKNAAAAYSALISALATIFMLCFCILLKADAVAEVVADASTISEQLWSMLVFERAAVSIAFFTIFFVVLAYVLANTMKQIYGVRQVPTIVYRGSLRSGNAVELRSMHQLVYHPTSTEVVYHAFLSHTWSTGQDAMRGLKELLREVLPGISVFLDVDDLAEVRKLGQHINESLVIVVFLSKGYFRSLATMREFIEALALQYRRELEHRAFNRGRSRTEAPRSIVLVRESASEKLENSLSSDQMNAELDQAGIQYGKMPSLLQKARNIVVESLKEMRKPKLPRLSELLRTKQKSVVAGGKRMSMDDQKELDLLLVDDEVIEYTKHLTTNIIKQILHPNGLLWHESVLWLRVKLFQQVTLVRLARSLVDIKPDKNESISMANGPLDKRITLRSARPHEYHVYVSVNNTGAMDLVEELRPTIAGRFQVAYSSD